MNQYCDISFTTFEINLVSKHIKASLLESPRSIIFYGFRVSVSNGNKSCVLIRDVRCINARLLLMFVTRHHAKHVLNYEYLTSVRILHTRVGKCDEI